LYLLPAAPFPKQVTLGPPLAVARGDSGGGWLTFDLGVARTVRAVQLQTRGHYVLLRQTVRVETSLDGAAWTAAAEEAVGRPRAGRVVRRSARRPDPPAAARSCPHASCASTRPRSDRRQ
jgi:hypothetical protein